jgi:hypothetical protein
VSDATDDAVVVDRRRWSVERLREAEIDFLDEHDWTYVGDDLWLPPPGMFEGDRATTPRRTGHAVNTQKFFTYRKR